ncbi:hypothetical protein D3C81_1852930 [compost metagenome]
MAQAANDAPGQGGFTRPQVAVQKYDAMPLGHLGNTGAQRHHGVFIGQIQGYFRHGACSSSN